MIRRHRAKRKLLATSALSLVVLTACGGEDENSAPAPAPSNAGASNHIHGLGIDPADGSLFVATHSGLFRAPKGTTEPGLVGKQSQDTMGFTVVGPNRFLGSGHPGPGQPGPPNLGLVESSDAGRTWSMVSLAGQADLHVLKYAHRRIYAYNALTNELLLSADAGKKWESRTPPAPVIDLAVDPQGPQQLVASTELGLHTSSDDGKTWQPIAGEAGLLAWPERSSLYLINASGQVQISDDDGNHWRTVGQIGGQPVAFIAIDPNTLYAALPDGRVKSSSDGGASWRLRASL